MIEKIFHKRKLLALIVKGTYRKKKGITFFTPNESTQQFGYMKHKKKHIIKPHLHKKRITKIIHQIILLKNFLSLKPYLNMVLLLEPYPSFHLLQYHLKNL